MPVYSAPVAEQLFLLHDWLQVHARPDVPALADATPDLSAQVLDAAARFFTQELHPIHQRADEEGARLVDGRVRTPAGFPQAWQRYAEAGWPRLTVDAAIGGTGLPPVYGVAVEEMGIACGHAFLMYGAFCPSAASMLARLGAPWMREHVVPALLAGRWTATMCLTEPHCGTDLRQTRSRAVPQADGTWRLHGQKIFISGGDHDLTEAIAHIVLAKVPEADGTLAPGLGSVNVFLVPSRHIDTATGALGGRNAVQVASIESKMGIGASATCALHFDGATAWRIGGRVAGKGEGSAANMAAMFLMMNHARVGTAISGVAYAEIALQNARLHAQQRLSGRSAGGPRRPDLPADPIVVHADVRRLLLDARAFAEGGRATAMRAALWQTLAAHSPDAAERERAADLLDLLTPVMKAYFTDQGFDAANGALQVLGGHGYIRDAGLEHFVRNARIGQIYEGANGIQAMDLVQRKLPAHGGRALRHFDAGVRETVQRLAARPGGTAMADALAAGLAHLHAALAALGRHAPQQPDAPGAAAYDLLTMVGILAVAWSWGDIAALPVAGGDRTRLARVWFARQLPLLAALRARVDAGPAALCDWADEAV